MKAAQATFTWAGGEIPQLLTNAEVHTISAEPTTNVWRYLLGKEKLIIATLTEIQHDPQIILELCEWLTHLTEQGVFGAGWVYHSDSTEWMLKYPTPEHGAFVRGGEETPDMALPRHEFLQCISAIVHWSQRRLTGDVPADTLFGGTPTATAVQQLAESIIFRPESCRKLLGVPMAATTQRGIKQETLIKKQQFQYNDSLRIESVKAAGINPTFATTGPSITAMIDCIRHVYGDPIMHLTAAEFVELETYTNGQGFLLNWATSALTTVPTEITNTIRYTHTKRTLAGLYMGVILQLITKLELCDPRRKIFAQKLGILYDHACNESWAELDEMLALGDSYNSFTHAWHRDEQVIRVLTEEHLNELITQLRKDYPQTGNPFDPCVSAPDVVADVVNTLNLPPESARYYLQILALVYPTDVNIRTWNGWKKKDIDHAATPLVEVGLLLEAQRPGAGRSRFLPGGWLEKVPRIVPMETWKAPHYLLWRSTTCRPIVRGCPPLQSLDQLFATVWERYKTGDIPKYGELATRPYRRR